MPRPLKIKLGDETWRAHFTVRPPKVDGEDCIGAYCPGDRCLKFFRGMPEHERRETFIHELLHAFLPHYDEDWIETTAEQMSEALTKLEEAIER